jgi:integrase
MHIQPPSTPPDPPASSTAGPPFTVESALPRVAGWTDLSPARRRDLASILSTVARMAGLPHGTMLLTPASLRVGVLDRSAAAYGLSEGTMRNVLSGLRYVLRRLDVIAPADGPLTPAWEAQLARLDRHRRAGLIAFARFCSKHGTPPEAVSIGTLQAFEAHLVTRTLVTRPRKAAGAVRGNWNRACAGVAGWAGRPLERPRDEDEYVLPLRAFPESFQADLATFGQQLEAPTRSDPDDPGVEDGDEAPLTCRAMRATTVALRQSHARWAASALVASGVPIADVTSLASLVTPPQRAQAAIRYLYHRAGRGPSAAGQHVAEVLRIIAKHHVRLSPGLVARIQRWGKPVALSYRGMTERNERQVREMMQPERLERLLKLPDALMGAARQLRVTAPKQARTLALRAVAIGILTKLPLRLANLAGLRLDRHFHRPDPRRGTISHLLIPAEDTKNRRPISLPVSRDTASLIQEWVTHHRPTAVPGCAYLFPGDGTGDRPIGHQGLRDAIKGALRTHVGVELSPHQFRHLAARLFLDAFPGHYEEVRQLLGHATVVSTTRHYSGVESEATARRFDEVVLGRHAIRPARDSHVPGRPKSSRRRRR